MYQTDIDELRDELRNYYGTAAVAMGNGDPFGCIPPLTEMLNVDDLSDDEVIAEAKRLGIIQNKIFIMIICKITSKNQVISKYAFSGCESLKEIEAPENVDISKLI